MSIINVRQSEIQGNGVFVKKYFRKGEIILQIDDSHIVVDESKLTQEDWEYNADFLNGKIIIMQEPERCINHSCDPNTYVKTMEGIRNVIARRDIQEGEEITYDYAINGDNEGAFPCHCGEKRCRKICIGNYFKLPIEFQIEYLSYLDEWFQQQYENEIAIIRNV